MKLAATMAPATVRCLFVRGTALVFTVAFLSFWRQAHGLIGPGGILPAEDYLASAAEHVGAVDAMLLLPTLLWSGAGDTALHLLCGGGTLASLLVVLGVAPAIGLGVCWICYLSLVHAGQIFLSYQWDMLLLEAGFLSILWAPLVLRPRLLWPGAPPVVVGWLTRWLLFRLMWSSGMVKLFSGDTTWRNLTALRFHYETQPIPAWTSHYVHYWPTWLHTGGVVFTFVVELLLPLAIFGPRRWRLAAAAGFAGLQLSIAATGNYGFFNLLTLVLCLPLLQGDRRPLAGSPARVWPVQVLTPVALLVFVLGTVNLASTMRLSLPGATRLDSVQRLLAPLHLSSGYGLFAQMTTTRPEIIVEGSQDGDSWHEYQFRWKASDPGRRPAFAPLHMPRLDWQLWFAALRGYERARWFGHFAARLLEGAPDVLDLLAEDPFAGSPPRYLRARLFDYRFSDPSERAGGIWWRRSELGPYSPVLSLRPLRNR